MCNRFFESDYNIVLSFSDKVKNLVLKFKRRECINHGWTFLEARGTFKADSRLAVSKVQKCSWTQWEAEGPLFMF